MPEFRELWPGGPLFAQAENQRLSTDSVLLADFIRPGPARRGMDLGCASGAISLLLLTHSDKLHMTGVELDPVAAALARANREQNRLEERFEVLEADLRRCAELFRPGQFDLVAANPPYFPLGRGALSPDPARAAARSETNCTLDDICRAAAWLLRTGGSLYLVHKPERLSELLCTMTACGIEPKRLRFVCPRPGAAPSLLLVEGRRGGRPGLQVEASLLLSGPDGGESAEYRRIYHRT